MTESKRWTWWLDAVLLFVMASALVWPLYKVKYLDKWASIESTFVSDARFLRDHWPHPRWQPLWYTGTRFDYVYPPALRYGTAGLMKAYPKLIPVRAYHIYVAVLYCLGIVGVYLLARMGGGSRIWAAFAAIGVAIVAPSFVIFPDMKHDAAGDAFAPQRLSVLIRYGEGPHMSAVALLGFALAFSWRALRTGGTLWIALAALGSALVVAHNFYGATALVMLFPMMLWAVWITQPSWAPFWRAAVIAMLTFSMNAFWLVPSYITLTLANMRFVSQPGNPFSLWVALFLLIVYLKLTERWAKGKPDLAYPVFLIGAFWLFCLNVVGNYFLQFRIIGEPTRMVPELDLIVLLCIAELLRRLWDSPVRWRMAVAGLLGAGILASGNYYVFHPWRMYFKSEDYTERLEYQITNWLHQNMPQARSYTTGTVRFWFNAWYDLAELGGGSEQGLLNPIVQPATWHLGLQENPKPCIDWLLATGTDAAIVHDKTSREHYKDVSHPDKFIGVLEAVYDDGKGNRIFKVPRRYPSLARVVETTKLDALPMLPEDPPNEQLAQLVEVLEKGPEAPTTTAWQGTDVLRIHAPVKEGQTLFLQVAYDTPWRAYLNGKPLPIRKTQLNFMRIEAPPGEHDIELVFELPLENIVGRIIFVAGLLWLIWKAFQWKRRA